MLVKDELKKLGLHFVFVDLGEVDVMEELSAEQLSELKLALLQSGLELMDDKKAVLLEKIKAAVIEMIYLDTDDIVKINFSDYLGKKLRRL